MSEILVLQALVLSDWGHAAKTADTLDAALEQFERSEQDSAEAFRGLVELLTACGVAVGHDPKELIGAEWSHIRTWLAPPQATETLDEAVEWANPVVPEISTDGRSVEGHDAQPPTDSTSSDLTRVVPEPALSQVAQQPPPGPEVIWGAENPPAAERPDPKRRSRKRPRSSAGRQLDRNQDWVAGWLVTDDMLEHAAGVVPHWRVHAVGVSRMERSLASLRAALKLDRAQALADTRAIVRQMIEAGELHVSDSYQRSQTDDGFRLKV